MIEEVDKLVLEHIPDDDDEDFPSGNIDEVSNAKGRKPFLSKNGFRRLYEKVVGLFPNKLPSAKSEEFRSLVLETKREELSDPNAVIELSESTLRRRIKKELKMIAKENNNFNYIPYVDENSTQRGNKATRSIMRALFGSPDEPSNDFVCKIQHALQLYDSLLPGQRSSDCYKVAGIGRKTFYTALRSRSKPIEYVPPDDLKAGRKKLLSKNGHRRLFEKVMNSSHLNLKTSKANDFVDIIRETVREEAANPNAEIPLSRTTLRRILKDLRIMAGIPIDQIPNDQYNTIEIDSSDGDENTLLESELGKRKLISISIPSINTNHSNQTQIPSPIYANVAQIYRDENSMLPLPKKPNVAKMNRCALFHLCGFQSPAGINDMNVWIRCPNKGCKVRFCFRCCMGGENVLGRHRQVCGT